jgi:3-oxoacyl-[acyl-carrier protein] reductase
MTESEFEGKTFVVTGASRGIGEGIARALIEQGAHVIGTYNTGKAEAGALTRELGDRLTMQQVDLSAAEQLAEFVDSFNGHPRLDGLVNNAGAIDFQLWEDFTAQSWLSVFAVNVTAPVILVHGLRDKFVKGGSVVNIASTDGYTGTFGSIAYSASKAALINATKSLGNVMGGAGVRVNAVAPGWIDTGMSTEASYAAAGLTPLARNGTPQDVAAVVSFLLSGKAAFVNGATIIVDGGYTNVDSTMKQEYSDLETESPESA